MSHRTDAAAVEDTADVAVNLFVQALLPGIHGSAAPSTAQHENRG